MDSGVHTVDGHVFQGLMIKADVKVSHRLVTVPFTHELCGNSCHAVDKTVILF